MIKQPVDSKAEMIESGKGTKKKRKQKRRKTCLFL